MAKSNKNKFEKVFYIVQTVPVFKICGHAFDRDEAKKLAMVVKKYTGQKGRVVEFSRDELEMLEFAQR